MMQRGVFSDLKGLATALLGVIRETSRKRVRHLRNRSASLAPENGRS